MESGDQLQRKIKSAETLQSVVKNLKMMAAVSIGPYERAVAALADYYAAVELGLMACLQRGKPDIAVNHLTSDHLTISNQGSAPEHTGVVVFGSDQGMVGQFNDHLAGFVVQELEKLSGTKTVWPVGEQIYARLVAGPLAVERPEQTPDTVGGITPVIGRLLLMVEEHRTATRLDQVLLYHNRPRPGAGYDPVFQRLLPLDSRWLVELRTRRWPTPALPQVRRQPGETFAAVLREYLFVSLFRACAESLSSENAARLVAMQGAEDNINRLLDQLRTEYNQERQNSIDAELFEILAGPST